MTVVTAPMTKSKPRQACCDMMPASTNTKSVRELLGPVNSANGLCGHSSVHNCYNLAQPNNTLCQMCAQGQCS